MKSASLVSRAVAGARLKCSGLGNSVSIIPRTFNGREGGRRWSSSSSSSSSSSKSTLFTAGAFTLSATSLYFVSSNDELPFVAAASAAAVPAPPVEAPIQVSSIEELVSRLKKADLDIILYQYEPCPFCNKARAYMDYHKIPYKIFEVNPMTKSELKWSEYKKVPVVVINGVQVNDSTNIITTLHQIMEKEKKPNMKKPTAKELAAQEEEAKWRQWADGHLVHLLPPNIYRSTGEAIQAFDYLSSEVNFPTYTRLFAKYGGAGAMYFVSKKLKKKYIPEGKTEREALYEAATDFTAALGDKRPFLGGEEPNLADLAVYGVLRSIQGLDAFNDMLQNSNIGPWYYKVQGKVGSSARRYSLDK